MTKFKNIPWNEGRLSHNLLRGILPDELLRVLQHKVLQKCAVMKMGNEEIPECKVVNRCLQYRLKRPCGEM